MIDRRDGPIEHVVRAMLAYAAFNGRASRLSIFGDGFFVESLDGYARVGWQMKVFFNSSSHCKDIESKSQYQNPTPLERRTKAKRSSVALSAAAARSRSVKSSMEPNMRTATPR